LSDSDGGTRWAGITDLRGLAAALDSRVNTGRAADDGLVAADDPRLIVALLERDHVHGGSV